MKTFKIVVSALVVLASLFAIAVTVLALLVAVAKILMSKKK